MITRVFINRCRDKKRLHARDRGASRNPAHVLYERRRNESEKKKIRCIPVPRRKLTNIYSRFQPAQHASVSLSLSLSFFLLASSIDIVARPPLHLFPLFVSDLNLRPGYQLAALTLRFAPPQRLDLCHRGDYRRRGNYLRFSTTPRF